LFRAGHLDKARRLQIMLARADGAAARAGFAGIKAMMEEFRGYGGVPRKPCGVPGNTELARLQEAFAEVMGVEVELEPEAKMQAVTPVAKFGCGP
jgi:dihydrodipicolinate synthase/N-acetylneuraminate lyase